VTFSIFDLVIDDLLVDSIGNKSTIENQQVDNPAHEIID